MCYGDSIIDQDHSLISFKPIFALRLHMFAGLASIIGGLALMSGRYVRLAAYGFVVYTLLVNVLIHPFWVARSELQNFIKNLGITAGLPVLAGYAAPRWPSLKGCGKVMGCVITWSLNGARY